MEQQIEEGSKKAKKDRTEASAANFRFSFCGETEGSGRTYFDKIIGRVDSALESHVTQGMERKPSSRSTT